MVVFDEGLNAVKLILLLIIIGIVFSLIVVAFGVNPVSYVTNGLGFISNNTTSTVGAII